MPSFQLSTVPHQEAAARFLVLSIMSFHSYAHVAVRAPLEVIKDQSLFRVRTIAVLMIVCNPLIYWCWTYLYPQPYESFAWRLASVLAGVVLLLASFRFKPGDQLLEAVYLFTSFFGTVFLGAWFYIGNSANEVWLASFCVLSMLYFTSTDWRLAVIGAVSAVCVAFLFFPLTYPMRWAAISGELFLGPALVVTVFTIATALLAHAIDKNVRLLQLENQFKALGVAAHEVRTPLAGVGLLGEAITTRLYELKAGQPIDAEALNAMREIASEIERNVEATADLISTHLANANPLHRFSHREPVTMSTAAYDAVRNFEASDASRLRIVGVKVSSDFTILVDRTIIAQVFRNLLENAYTATLKKHPRAPHDSIRIYITSDSSRKRGRCEIWDFGVGIKKADLHKIFSPFFSTSDGMGHGLGLTFVRSAVRAYGGSISVESTETGGTLFSLEFPLVNP